ncbi:SDR family oxidoreductase [Rubritalea marina]|uniref:SDR family oxidoreductase n=1 Tax=Rubritalea marina TaxID=361055 RepID=UPI00035C46EF|nr:SDR family oxidoreductase [Rubritalea marina]
MNLNLNDKVVIVTGGSKGIGAGCVEAFAAEGAIPVIVGRSPAVGEELIKQCGRGAVIEAELSSEEACKQAIEQTLAQFGRIDGIVHNAGVNDGVSLGHSPSDFMGSLQKNIFHVFALTHYALEALKASKGFIINVSSKVADTGQGDTSGYAASKGAMNALTREWALSLAKDGIRVNTVVPAEVMTPLYQNWLNTLEDPEGTLQQIEARVPFGQRMTSASEIANMVVFLASERSSHTTGQIMYPDGGYVHFDRSYGAVEKE